MELLLQRLSIHKIYNTDYNNSAIRVLLFFSFISEIVFATFVSWTFSLAALHLSLSN